MAAGTATVGFLIWIAVPSGGGLLTNFAAGFPTSATSQPTNATAPAPGQGAPPSSASDLATPAMVSPGAAGITGDGSVGSDLGSPAGDGGIGGSLSSDSGGGTSTPGPNAAPGPTTPSSTCPVSFPSTGTPIDSLAAQLSALCAQVVGRGSGTVPAGALPGGGSVAQAGGGQPHVAEQWMYLDAPVGASGAANAGWSPALSAEMAGKAPIVQVGLVQGSLVSPALAGAIGDLVHHGALVQVVLVPQPSTPGGPPAFASWVTEVLAAFGPAPLVEIGTGAAPQGASAGSVASYTLAGLTAADAAPGGPSAGVVWLDGGTGSADPAVWSSLESDGLWPKASFVATSLDATAACSSPAAFAAAVRRFPAAAGLPVVSEAVQAPAAAAWVGADYSCVRALVAQAPVASVAMWRLWEGPVPR